MGVEVAATGGGCAVAEGPVRPPRLRTGSSRAPRAPETAPKPYVEQTFTTGFRGRRSVRAAQFCVRSESPFRSQHQNSHSSAWPRLGPCKPQREHRTLTCLSPHGHTRTYAHICTHTHAQHSGSKPARADTLPPAPEVQGQKRSGKGQGLVCGSTDRRHGLSRAHLHGLTLKSHKEHKP